MFIIILHCPQFCVYISILTPVTVYHCGASINRIGYKTFSITLINDKTIIDALLNRIEKDK